MTAESFEQTARRWLGSFAQDLKDFLHVVCDDPELDDTLREQAAGAMLYALAPGDVVPDSAGPLGYVDDALALRVVLAEVAARAPSCFERYGDRIPEMVSVLDADLATARAFFGETYDPFRARVLASERLEFKGKRVADVLSDPEWVDAELAVAALKLDFKPADVSSALKRLSSLQATFRQKLGASK